MSMTKARPSTNRDGAVISVVAVAHFTSHVAQFALPTLFASLHRQFDVDFVQLGLVATLFFLASGLGQSAAGVLVDRLGAHRLLAGGLVLLAGGIGLMGLVPSYWMLLPLAVIAGLGNAVFHPADLSILSRRISDGRLGRAFALHGIAGSLGFACGPILVATIASFTNWRVALVCIAILTAGAAILVRATHRILAYGPGPIRHAAQPAPRYLDLIGSPVIVLAFGYFVLTAFAGTGIQTFGVAAFQSGFGLGPMAAFSITCYFGGSAAGTAIGGFLAERTDHHHRVAMAGLIVTAVLILAVGAMNVLAAALVPASMAVAGISNGITAPSRDVLVRRAAAGAGMGSVFGFVYSGFDLGSSTAPLLFGSFLDHQAPHLVFVVAALVFLLAVPTVMQVQHQSRRKALAETLQA